MNIRCKSRVLSVILVFLMLGACTTKKDGTAYRLFHNMTGHYNGYFNANELVVKGANTLAANHKDDYDKILPIFLYGTPEEAKALYPDMEKAIAKCEKVISRHTIKDDSNEDKKHPEFNKWIDDNYMVIGQAYFYKQSYYKSADIFQYVNRKFKKPEASVKSNTWLAKTYVEDKEYGKAIQALVRAEGDVDNDKVDNKLRAEYHLAYADAYLHQKKWEKAATELENSLKYIDRKKDKARPHFILAQLYQQMNRSSDAITHYEAVVHSRAPYELEFHARINKALSYSRTGGSSGEIQKELFKMLKDEKNADYADQIYYALGDIAWEEQRREDAINFYQKSIESNTTNAKQRAKAFLRLADLYFDDRSYALAQLYYDSTLTKIDEKHERYAMIKARAESLTELVGHLEAIALYDSLNVICALSPDELDKKVKQMAEQMAVAMEQQRLEDERRAEQARQAAAESGISGTFWCYNEELRENGRNTFSDEWGDRPLKDYWRLQSKLAESFGPGEEVVAVEEAAADSSGAVSDDKYKTPSADELKSSLPCADDANMKSIKKAAAEGYYNAGVVYKEKLDDDDNAISTWEELLANMDESSYHPTTYYQLFRTWLAKEGTKGYVKNPFCESCNSKYWGDEIKTRYPNSDWAMLVDNPGYLDIQDMKKAKENEAYQIAYGYYTGRSYGRAKNYCDSVITADPQNRLLCKYKLLRAICVGYSDAPFGVKENYQAELNRLVQECTGTEEAARADQLLRVLTAGDEINTSAPLQTNPSMPSDSLMQTTPPGDSLAADDGPYIFDANAEHYLAVLMPVSGSDINTAKAAVADFNLMFFNSMQLRVTNNLLDKDHHMLLVKSFKKPEDAKQYHGAFIGDTDKLATLNVDGNHVFLISKQNYIALFKGKDYQLYLDFFARYY
ncbi:MAG: tetratricopeptide repeat protein [Flavobacteriales bacterium]